MKYLVNFKIHDYFPMVFQKLLTVSGVRCFHESVVSSGKYEEAIEKLNSLQSNGALLEKMRQNREWYKNRNVEQTEKYLNKIGVKVDELDKLNIIHVTGTKGKGSTSAFCESLLRNRGFKTGFYSSPHLVAVRERIRLNGKPISKEKFISYFWHVYNNLFSQKENETDMPAYFKFLTVMALYVFLQEKIDVAIVEVGIGGLHDCTNIFRNPVVCGVTSLGIDHVNVLGSTIDKIAWQKAGIFKPNVPAFTVNQPMEAMNVLFSRAKEVGCPLHVVPSLEFHTDRKRLRSLTFSSSIQMVNAGLAVQLAHTWLERHKMSKSASNGHALIDSTLNEVPLDDKTINALKSCNWPGRFQTMNCGSLTYFLDGAHTSESIELCAEWFQKVSKQQSKTVHGSVFKILVFNVFGERQPEKLFPPLLACDFDLVAFCPNFAHVSASTTVDQVAVATNWESQMERCTYNSHVWMQLVEEKMRKLQEDDAVKVENNSSVKTVVFPSICDVVKWMSQGRISHDGINYNTIPMLKSDKFMNASHVHVLVTGSIRLIGGFLEILDPDLSLMDPKKITGIHAVSQ